MRYRSAGIVCMGLAGELRQGLVSSTSKVQRVYGGGVGSSVYGCTLWVAG